MLKIKTQLITNLDRDNRIYFFLFALFPGVLASVTSFMLAIAFLGAILFLLLRFFPWAIRRDQKLALYAISVYPTIMILAVLLNERSSMEWSWIFRVLPFYAGWFLLARMRTSPDGTLVSCLIFGSGIGMIATFAICMFQFFFIEDRVAGGAGNAAVLGLFTVLFSNIALMNAHSQNKIESLVAIFGFILGVCSLFLSETRSAWLVLPINIVIVLLYLQKRIQINYKKIAVPILIGFIAAGSVFYPKISSRIQSLEYDIQALDVTPQDMTSLSIRLMIWRGGLAAAADHPVLGYGAQNRMAAVEDHLPSQLAAKVSVTHLHNAFLNVAVDAGLLGVIGLILALAAPILAAAKKEPGPERDASMTIALMLVVSYVVTGMFGIMFGHDATDAIYITTFLAICHGAGSVRLCSVVDQYLAVRKI